MVSPGRCGAAAARGFPGGVSVAAARWRMRDTPGGRIRFGDRAHAMADLDFRGVVEKHCWSSTTSLTTFESRPTAAPGARRSTAKDPAARGFPALVPIPAGDNRFCPSNTAEPAGTYGHRLHCLANLRINASFRGPQLFTRRSHHRPIQEARHGFADLSVSELNVEGQKRFQTVSTSLAAERPSYPGPATPEPKRSSDHRSQPPRVPGIFRCQRPK